MASIEAPEAVAIDTFAGLYDTNHPLSLAIVQLAPVSEHRVSDGKANVTEEKADSVSAKFAT